MKTAPRNAASQDARMSTAVHRLDGLDVLDLCHREILFSLGKLSALVARLATFGPDGEARAMAQEIFVFFTTTVRRHHDDEERHVFPRLIAGGNPQITRAVLKLQTDHNWLEEDWMSLAPHLATLASGRHWSDFEALRDASAGFTALMHDHIALEESCIYPEARSRLGVAERREMGREMAARRRAGGRSSP
jgi:iron-sulfur cluster repair protein YtfE (RIC family)